MKTTFKTKANQWVRTGTPSLSPLPLEKISAILASPFCTQLITESQHGRGGKGHLRLCRTSSQVLNISKDGDYSKFQCLPSSGHSIGLRWAHSAEIPEAAFCISAPLFYSVTEPKSPGPRGTEDGILPAQLRQLQLCKASGLLAANKTMKFYKEKKRFKKIPNLCILLSSPCGKVLNQHLN